MPDPTNSDSPTASQAPAARPDAGATSGPAFSVPRLVAEFTVVFLGVYSAFLLDGCRARDQEEQKRQQIEQILAEDFLEGRQSLRELSAWFESSLGETVLDPLSAGDTPRPLPIPLPSSLQWEGWGAMLASGGLEVLDTRLIRDVERAIAQIQQLGHLADEYNDYVRTVLVPDLERDTSGFYLDDGSQLRSRYLWYWYSLDGYRRGLVAATKQFDALAARLADTQGDST